MNNLHLLMVVGLGAVAVACGGTSSDASSPTEQGDEQDVTAALSKGLLCAAVSAAVDADNDATGLVSVPESDLKGAALSDFKEFQKGMTADYPSAAFKLPVKFSDKTYTFIFVSETNDGGGSMGVYRTSGAHVASMSASENGVGTWTSPADKCPGQ